MTRPPWRTHASCSGYSKTNDVNLTAVGEGPPAWEALVAEFARRYANPRTKRYYERDLALLFSFAEVDAPRLLSESMVLEWCGMAKANNSVRNRLSRVCTFLRWCVRQGEADAAPVETLMGRDNPLRQIPRLYGQVQGAQPARWLTHEEAFDATPPRVPAEGTSAVWRTAAGSPRCPRLYSFSQQKGFAMRIRSLHIDDYPAVTDLLTETFRPFFEDYARPLLGEQVFQHQHGHWEQDYRDELPTLHAPERRRYAAVASLADGAAAGLISWRFDAEARHGEIYLLAVSEYHRRQNIGRKLCEHAIAHMRTGGVEVIQIGTGGDPFHAPARFLYERLGFTPVPVVVYLGTT